MGEVRWGGAWCILSICEFLKTFSGIRSLYIDGFLGFYFFLSSFSFPEEFSHVREQASPELLNAPNLKIQSQDPGQSLAEIEPTFGMQSGHTSGPEADQLEKTGTFTLPTYKLNPAHAGCAAESHQQGSVLDLNIKDCLKFTVVTETVLYQWIVNVLNVNFFGHQSMYNNLLSQSKNKYLGIYMYSLICIRPPTLIP